MNSLIRFPPPTRTEHRESGSQTRTATPDTLKRPGKLALLSIVMLVVTAVLPVSAQNSLTDSAGHELRLIPAGHFIMGHNNQRRSIESVFAEDNMLTIQHNEHPPHETYITRPFYLASREVTVRQFKQFVAATRYVTTAEKGDGIVGWHPLDEQLSNQSVWRRFKQMPAYNWRSPGFEQTDDDPVVGVCWDDTQAYCRWLSDNEVKTYRLPTEAEWEYACLAGRETFFSFGDAYHDNLHQHANFADITLENAHERTAAQMWYVTDSRNMSDGSVFPCPVGRYSSNAWGLFDMHGNVWEWCHDLYDERYYSRYEQRSATEPRYARAFDPVNNDEPWNESGNWRTIRGGAWCNAPEMLRACRRSWFEQGDGACYIGFRVARDAPADMVRESHAQFTGQEQARRAITAMRGVRWEVAYSDDMSLSLNVPEPTVGLATLLPKIPRIGKLRVDGRRGGVNGELVQAIAELKSLRSLELDSVGNQVPGEAYAALASLPDLEELKFRNETTIAPRQLTRFRSLEQLTVLAIHTSGLTADQFDVIRGRSFGKLQNLELSRTQCDGTVLEYFRDAPITQLALGILTDDGAEHVAKLHNLVDLRIDQPQITSVGIRHLATLEKLQSLRLNNLSLHDADFVPLGQMTGLRALELNGSGAGDETALAISELPLRMLTIGSPALTDKGLRYIGNICTLRRSLEIGPAAAITDAGLRHLWGSDHLPELRIHTQGITGDGLSTISRELAGIRRLALASSEFTNEGLRFVGYMPNLEQLELGSHHNGFPRQVTDAGLMLLAEAPRLRRLRLRRDNSRRITTDGIATLKVRLPNLEVEEW